MKLLLITITLLLFSSVYSVCVPKQFAYDNWDCYTTVEGDSIEKIAEYFGTHPDLVCDYNKNFIRDCKNITAGLELMIPPTCTPLQDVWDCVAVPDVSSSNSSVLTDLGNSYQLPGQLIFNYNKRFLKDLQHIAKGMRIRVPINHPMRFYCVPDEDHYCVSTYASDTVDKIAQEQGVKREEFLKVNDILSPYNENSTFADGWLLKVPTKCRAKENSHFCYKCQESDTIESIAQMFNITKDMLKQFNRDILQQAKSSASDNATATDNTTMPADNTTMPADNTTLPADNTTVPVDNTTLPADNTTVPVDNTTVPVDNTTFPADNSTGSDNSTGVDNSTNAASGSQDEEVFNLKDLELRIPILIDGELPQDEGAIDNSNNTTVASGGTDSGNMTNCTNSVSGDGSSDSNSTNCTQPIQPIEPIQPIDNTTNSTNTTNDSNATNTTSQCTDDELSKIMAENEDLKAQLEELRHKCDEE